MPDAQWLPSSRREYRVLLALLSGASNLSGLTICAAAGMRPGTVHPVLACLEGHGWVASTWRDHGDARPRTRIYHLTARGRYYAMRTLGLEVADPAVPQAADAVDAARAAVQLMCSTGQLLTPLTLARATVEAAAPILAEGMPGER